MALNRWLALAAVVTALAGCGSDDDSAAGGETASNATTANAGNRYPAEVRRNFLSSCDAQKGATRKVCACALVELERTVAFDDFKQADAALREGKRPPARVQRRLTASIRKCA